ncbi:MAG: family 43 glycosylhydrolase [Bacteroidaceae bacterium]|nr:family 43 glycosylhydrolase [Bacteroidaceae bacterium]
MRKMRYVVCVVWAVLATLSGSAQEEAGIVNPVWGRDWPDPTVWQAEDSVYYSIATGGGWLIKSTDLRTWQPAFVRPIDEESWRQMHAVGRHFWAPDVTVVAGRRLLYATLYNSAEDSHIAVLREEQPGHFRYAGCITHSTETGIDDTIDPEVVTDTTTGRVWLFFGSVGGIHRVELNADGLSVKEGATYEHVAGLTIRQNPSRNRVFEGAYLHHRQGYWYLFVSSGHYNDHTYRLRVGRSRELTGTFVSKEGKPMADGHATTVLHSERGDRFYGPGHCGEIFTGKDGRDYIFYHCHDTQQRRASARPMMLSRIQWDEEGWPYVEGGKP